MPVLDRTARVSAREPCEPVPAQPLRGVAHGRFVVVGHRMAVGRLIARQPQRVQRERVLVGRRQPLLDQAPEHALLGGGEWAELHLARA